MPEEVDDIQQWLNQSGYSNIDTNTSMEYFYEPTIKVAQRI